MSEISLPELSDEALDMLRRHNLLKSLVRAITIENSVRAVELTSDEKKEVYESYLNKYNISTEEDLDAHLKLLGIDAKALHWNVELPIRISRFSKNKFGHKVEARFLAKKESLDQVVYSLLRVKDGFLARELYLRIANGEANFADLASAYSQGNEAKTKGIIGPVPIKQSHPILSERLRTAQAGELLEPFNVEEWWVIVRLERYEPARFVDATAEIMAKELFNEWVEEQVVSTICAN